MSTFQSHLTVLQSAATNFSSRPVFRVPKVSSSNVIEAWIPITFKDFSDDVELAARFWFKKLSSRKIAPRSVVGLWLSGFFYSDIVTMYGIARAGFVPQIFSLRLPNPDVIYELLRTAKADALIFDPSFSKVIAESPVSTFCAVQVREMHVSARDPLPAFPTPKSSDDIVLIFHTSGSTSGSPKLVPCCASWLDNLVLKASQVSAPKDRSRQDVSTFIGSMSHIAQNFMFIGSLIHGSCTIQPTRIDFSSEELVDMITRCNLNRLHQFGTFLSAHIRRARQNPKLFHLLKSLDCLLYCGVALGKEEDEFAFRNGLEVINLFGSTEVNAMMISAGSSNPGTRLLRTLNGVDYAFVPTGPAANATGHVSANNQLKELVILSSSPDCPHPSLRRSDDGHFHTGDLFLEVQPGAYIFRGRDDDWIKSFNSLRCDARAIEENVLATCAELVHGCIVVGNGRPSPVLFVEPAVADIDHQKLQKEIVRRIRPFHSRRYIHERITSIDCIVVVPQNTLPRTQTKGNIRRKAVEETYKTLLDDIFEVED